ncbi:hypothetical protein AJ78_03613 [Emergomyces pasteurianus Ep9510]|uniref:C2H2-type domain-containing protein n=1 Tax=Emergomyces pasteurianus Ep9510 TaxID=1447872 RepID=A0A1J9QLV6_9EURO|nr:hypothetical protein AJ78_03613 [Emergomyces pasteurianus Ep9510]
MGRHRVKKQEVNDNSDRIHLTTALNTDAKVKPYDCRFCDRSYGRKDLVVRHEKTLHEEEWNNTQRFIKKETNNSSGYSSSRRKSQLSSTSGSDELKSPAPPTRIPHRYGVADGLPHFSIQRAALLGSSDENDFNGKSYLPQANYNYLYPLTPRTQETVDYPHDSLIPDQYYVEEQYAHPYNHPMSEQSAETYEEPNVMPVDPNLLEGMNTKI